MVRPAFDTYEAGGGARQEYYGPQADETSFGGTGKILGIGPDGTPRVIGDGGTQQVDRYRGLAAAAANRQAYQGNALDTVIADRARYAGIQDRSSEADAAALLRQSAMGQAPSRAAALMPGQVDQSLQAQQMAAANSRGTLGQAVAARQGIMGMGQQQANTMGELGGMRAEEVGRAQGAYLGGEGGIRSNDFRAQGLMQDRSRLAMQSELEQRQLNQQMQQGYEQMGVDVNKAQMQAALQREGLFQRKNMALQDQQQATDDRNWKYVASGAQMVGGMAVMSDERIKTDKQPLSHSPVATQYDKPVEVLPLATPFEGYTMQQDFGPGLGHASYAPIIQAQPPTDAGARHLAYIQQQKEKEAAAAAAQQQAPSMAQAAAARKAVKPPERKMTPDELMAWAEKEKAKTEAATQAIPTQRPTVDPMGSALDQMQPYSYRFQPGVVGEDPNQYHVGPLLNEQTAAHPVAGAIVTRSPDGYLGIDNKEAHRFSLGALGYLKQRQDQQDAQIAALAARRGGQ